MCFRFVTIGTDCAIHAYKLCPDSDASDTASKKATSGGNNKKKSPTPLAPLTLQTEKLFSINHTNKINTIVCDFDTTSHHEGGSDSKPSSTDDANLGTNPTDSTGTAESATTKAKGDTLMRTFYDHHISCVKVYVGDLSNDISAYCSAR